MNRPKTSLFISYLIFCILQFSKYQFHPHTKVSPLKHTFCPNHRLTANNASACNGQLQAIDKCISGILLQICIWVSQKVNIFWLHSYLPGEKNQINAIYFCVIIVLASISIFKSDAFLLCAWFVLKEFTRHHWVSLRCPCFYTGTYRQTWIRSQTLVVSKWIDMFYCWVLRLFIVVKYYKETI